MANQSQQNQLSTGRISLLCLLLGGLALSSLASFAQAQIRPGPVPDTHPHLHLPADSLEHAFFHFNDPRLDSIFHKHWHDTTDECCGSHVSGPLGFVRPKYYSGQRSPLARLVPDTVQVRSRTDIEIVYVLSGSGLQPGEAIKIQLPQLWQPPQFNNPNQVNYSSVYSSRYDTLQIFQYSLATRDPLEGYKTSRVQTVTFTLQNHPLSVNDTLIFRFGNQYAGGTGYKVGRLAGLDYFVIGKDTTGNGTVKKVSRMPVYVESHPIYRLVAYLPSNPLKDSTVALKVIALDKFNNVVNGYRGTVSFTHLDGSATLPAAYTFTAADAGVRSFPVSFHDFDVHRIKVTDLDSGISCLTNPVVCKRPGEPRIFWGDLHTHTIYSGHGTGTPAEMFTYARDIVRLDFLAYTEHSYIPDSIYQQAIATGNQFHDPARFVVFHGYEWSSGPFGHKCIYFVTDTGGPIIDGNGKPEHLYQIARDYFGQVHDAHPASVTNPTNWSRHDEMQRNAEIVGHSGKRYEAPGPDTKDTSTIQAGLARGLRFGMVGASDNHWSRPAKHMYPWGEHGDPGDIGITAVYAEHLTRPDIFNALWERHNYATTGQRILIDFKVNGCQMGAEGMSTDSVVKVQYAVHAASSMASIELLRNNEVIYSAIYPGMDAVDSFTVLEPALDTTNFYYLRVTQKDSNLAWSSPVWIKRVPERTVAPAFIRNSGWGPSFKNNMRDTLPGRNSSRQEPYFHIVPNPNNGRFRLSYRVNETGPMNLKIMNAMGGKTYHAKVEVAYNYGSHYLDLSSLASGIYFLRIEIGGRQFTRRSVVLR